MNPAEFAWRPPPYEYEHKLLPIDILAGNATYREDIERGTIPRRMAESWKPAVAEFERLRQQYRFTLHLHSNAEARAPGASLRARGRSGARR